MLDQAEIKQVVDELIKKDNISSVIISSKDGQPLYGLNKDGSGFGEELFTIPVAIISAMQMSSAFMSSLKDEVHEYTIFQENRIVLSLRKREIVLTVFVETPQSSFERRIEVKQYAEMFKDYADKIDAIIQTIGLEGSIIEKVKREVPEATLIQLLSANGIPLSSLKETFELDDAQIAAISTGILLPTRALTDSTTECIAVRAKKYTLLLFPYEKDQILLVTVKGPKKPIETYMTKIAKILKETEDIRSKHSKEISNKNI